MVRMAAAVNVPHTRPRAKPDENDDHPDDHDPATTTPPSPRIPTPAFSRAASSQWGRGGSEEGEDGRGRGSSCVRFRFNDRRTEGVEGSEASKESMEATSSSSEWIPMRGERAGGRAADEV